MRYRQPATGFRSGIEPVLLAASIPAQAGARVLEGGTGAGAALLCLAARVPGLRGFGVEADPALAAIAAENLAANGFSGLRIAAGRIEDAAEAGFDHAFANPPYHTEASTASPHPGRRTAKQGVAEGIARWAEALVARLRPGGTLTLILPVARLPEALAALPASGCGSPAILPLWPRTGIAAKLVLLRGVRAGRAPLRLLPGVVLHAAGGGYTSEAEAILRGGAPLPF